MTPRSLVALIILGIAALAGGWYFGTDSTPSSQRAVDTGKLMFPDLAPRLQQATKIEVTHQGKPLMIEKQGARWGLTDRGGYPVQDTKLRSMLTALTELRLVEHRTADPTQFATLGVEDPAGKDANSNLLRVLDASGQPIVALIVGHRRVRTQGDVPEQVYVRRPNENQSWLAEGSLEVDADPQLWLDRDIMNIDHSRIARVTATRDDATLQFVRTGDKLLLATPADHPKLDDYKQEDVARALELLTFQDVHADAAAPGEAIGKAVFSTSDGLTVTASVFRAPPDPAAKPDADRDVLARFSASGDDKAKAEADMLQTRLAGWTYQLGAWKQKTLVPSLDDLKAPPTGKPAEPAEPTPAAVPDATPGATPGPPPDSPPASAPATEAKP